MIESSRPGQGPWAHQPDARRSQRFGTGQDSAPRSLEAGRGR